MKTTQGSEVHHVFSPFRLDPGNAQLWRDDEKISLRRKTFDVLRYLVEHPGQLVTKAMLLDAVWADVSVGDSMPATCVAELRRALGDDAKIPQFIETVHRRGYRFIAKVTTAAAREATRKPSPVAKSPKPIIVGRENELTQLQSRYSDVLEGQRRVIFVAGEAGIGKTTFVEAFLDSISRDNTVRVGRGQCLEQYGAGEPYMPLLEALSRLGRECDGAQVVEVLSKFAPTWLAQMPELLTREERARLQSDAQGVTQLRMLREMAQALEAIAAESPLVLLLEDLHWSDFSTLELISALARRREPARLMFIGTYRPVETLANDHPLRATKQELELHRYCEELRLKLLSQVNVAEYLARRFPGNGSRQFGTLAPVVHARTDGNPLFVVNVVDYLLGKAGLAIRSQEVSGEALIANGFDTPRSIRDMIERNLERLKPDEQAVLEGASVAGPEFSAASVAAALERPQNEIEACCVRLARREQFVSAQGPITWPDGTIASGFRFNNALYQEVLYGRLPAGHQLQLHRRIAVREEAGYGERASEVATELAYHYSRANDKDKAITYFQVAAKRASARRAYREAERHHRDALTILLSLPESPERDSRELTLQLALGRVLVPTLGWSGVDTAAVYARARTLAERVGGVESLQVFLGLWATAIGRGELRLALVLADQVLEIAHGISSPSAVVTAHFVQGLTRHGFGDLTSARQHFLQAIERYREEDFRGIPDDYGLAAHVWAGINEWLLGYPDLARRYTEHARTLAGLNKSFALAYVDAVGALPDILCGDFARARAAAEKAERLSTELGFPLFRTLGKIFGSWARANMGELSFALDSNRAGLVELDAMNYYWGRELFLSLLSETQALTGAVDDAIVTLEQALETNHDELWYRPLALRLRGELRLRSNAGGATRFELAEQDFREGIELARKMNAKSPELRATTSLARLLAQQGHHDEARTMLAEIYSWFTEGFDTADLKDAKALLDQLSEPSGPTLGSR